jgi:hypothetical protein
MEHTGYNSQVKMDTWEPKQPHHTSPARLPAGIRLIDRIGSPEPEQPPPDKETTVGTAAETEARPESVEKPSQAREVETQPGPFTKRLPVLDVAPMDVKGKGVGKKKLPQMYENSSDEEEDTYAYQTDTSVGFSDGDKEVAGKPFKFIGQPAPYRLDRVGSNCRNKSRHTCMIHKSSWDTKASLLYTRWEKNHKTLIWYSSGPMQMAKEAAMVPFDQRSHAQCWVIREATKAELLPMEDARAEPNMEQMAIARTFPETIWCDEDGYYNVKDITAWLLFKMAEPEEKELVDWFWWEACQIFSK